MQFKELVEKNRSYRGYDEKYVITREQLETLIDYTRFCPSSINFQPFKYFLSCDKETNAIIQPMTAWARRLQAQMTLPHEGKMPTAFIVICHDKNIGPNTERFSKDVGIVAQTILLGAVDMGLGGCMIGNYNPDKVKEALGLEENLQPVLIVALGKPDEKIVITDIPQSGEIGYYRDENDVHYVPKRSLKDILINK
ncbi:MAG: nitroreductase family protein [Clostridiaceae bacterium]|nr:nitroreductase family protein [Clostridiaceae bacterium]